MTTPGKWRVAITGGGGLVGRHLSAMLQGQGHAAWPVQRIAATAAGGVAQWNVASGELRVPGGIDAVVHLAGRTVVGRWTARVRREIYDSRVPATQKLCTFLASFPAEKRPRVLVAASAVGIYGDRGDEVLTEDSAIAPPESSFFAEVGRAWEAAADPARDAGIRVVTLRIGVVLSREGGALAKMATPVKWGLGGPIGPGTQYVPWISVTDLCRLILRALDDDQVHGVINAVTPNPVRQHEFMRTLGKVLRRPTVFPMPSFMVKLIFGKMGREALLASSRVVPTRLPAGFAFTHPTLEGAIRAELRGRE